MGKTTFDAEGARQKVVIYYNDIRSLNYFLDEDVEEDGEGGVSNASKVIPGHQRRKGPSDDSPINVKQSEAEYLVDPSLKSGNARPGRSFILQTMPTADVDATRRFTYTGRFMDLHSILSSNIAYDTYIYESSGGRHSMKVVIGEGQAQAAKAKR